MSLRNQGHGKAFERAALAVAGAKPAKSARGMFDGTLVETGRACRINVKTARDGGKAEKTTVYLADAVRMWRMGGRIGDLKPGESGALRFIVGTYRQEGGTKVVTAVHEIDLVFDNDTCGKIYGDIPVSDVLDFTLSLDSDVWGGYRATRKKAKARKAELSARGGTIQLNPKIDSKRQRRLQCSIALADLIAAARQHTVHEADYKGMPLPFSMASPARERNRNSSKTL